MIFKKIILVFSLVLYFKFSYGEFSMNDYDLRDQAKSCLASTYTAQRAFYEEYRYYSTSLKDLGVTNCSKFRIQFEFNNDQFAFTLLDKKSRGKIGFINNYKEIYFYR